MIPEEHQTELLRWVVALPLLGAVVHGVALGLLRRPLSRTATIALSCGVLVASFGFAFLSLLELVRLEPEQRFLVDGLYTWIGAGSFSAEASFLLDPLSAVMILMVTGVSLLIHVYSIGYMDDDRREDRGFQRFFCFLNLFVFSMLVLVLADNLVLMFLGWEGVGLCSYLLIGFWYSDAWNARCGTKAFIVNRIGDVGFLVGIFLVFWSLSAEGKATLDLLAVRDAFPLIADQMVTAPAFLSFLPMVPEWKLASVIGLCLFVGAVGKSAQIPLYVWLPDAMAGPTPVSALIHAATMVTAGVYMVCRLDFVYAAGPGAATVVAWTGALTALFAATLATAQTDIKKVLAYSTVSQLGYMFLAAGVGATSAAMFHVVTHAFFKALLFLAAGAVILAMHHEQDTDRMGGLARMIPRTHAAFLVGVLAIIGVPYFSGFFSKDAILLSTWLADDLPGHRTLWWMGVFTAGLTAFYMGRLYFRTFHGDFRGSESLRLQIAEPGPTVMVPLFVLALLAALGGLLLGPTEAFVPIEDPNSFARFLEPVLGASHHDVAVVVEWSFASLVVGFAGAGFLLAWVVTLRHPGFPARFRRVAWPLHRPVEARFWVDAAIDAGVVRPLVWFSDRVLFRGVDVGFIDAGLVGGTAAAVRGLGSRVLRFAQSGLPQGYLFIMVIGAVAIVGWLLR